MNEVPLTYEKLDPSLPDLEYAREGDAGFDLYAAEDWSISSRDISLVPTGMRFKIPPGFEIQIRPRSSMALGGTIIPNSPGTIDSGYTGDVKVPMIALTPRLSVHVRKGDRIAQGILAPVTRAVLKQGAVANDTGRGDKGFGSTGR